MRDFWEVLDFAWGNPGGDGSAREAEAEQPSDEGADHADDHGADDAVGLPLGEDDANVAATMEELYPMSELDDIPASDPEVEDKEVDHPLEAPEMVEPVATTPGPSSVAAAAKVRAKPDKSNNFDNTPKFDEVNSTDTATKIRQLRFWGAKNKSKKQHHDSRFQIQSVVFV